MSYEIPQKLEYQEKIIFNLTFPQLGYASLGLLIIIPILKQSWNLYVKITLISIISFISVLFMFFDFRKILLNYLSWMNFRDISFMSRKMNQLIGLNKITNNILELRIYKNKLLSKLTKQKSLKFEKVAIIKVFPLNFSINHDDDKTYIIKSFQKFLNSLDFPIQILIKTEPLNLSNYFKDINEDIKTKYKKHFQDYKDNIESLIKNNQAKNRSFYVIIKETSNLEIQANIILERLKTLRLKCNRLEEPEILKLLKQFFNEKENSSEKDVSKFNYLNYLVSPNNINNKIDHLVIDNKYHRVIVSHGYPRNVQQGFLDKIITSKGNFDISLHIEPLPIESTIVSINKELQKQRADLYSMKKNSILNTSLEIKYKDTKNILEELQRGQERLFNISLYIGITADSKQDLDFLTKKIESELNSLLILPKIPVFSIHKALRCMLPYCSNDLNYKRNITTEALSSFFPFTSKFLEIDKKGLFLGLNKNDIPIIKDIYSLGNQNGFILASSGFGKSFYAKLYIMRQLMMNTKVYVIDPQSEYLKLAEKFQAQVITISRDSLNMINPLDMMGHDYAEKRISLMDLFNVMLGGITDIQKAVLDKALTSCYNKKGITNNPSTWKNKSPILGDLLKELVIMSSKCSGIEKSTHNSIINRLSMYVDGVFSFMNQQTKIDFSNDFIVFNIRDIPKQVKPAIMFLILDYIYMKMNSNKEKKLLVIDESWSLLNRVEEAGYIFEIVKTSRKHNLSLLLITQDVLDLIDSKAGNAILSNSSYSILFSQKPAVISHVSKVFHLSNDEQELLLTSDIGHGLMIMDNEHSELKVIASKEEYDIITTNPNEKRKEPITKDVPIIKLNLEKRFYLKNKLKKEEIEYLLDNEYVISSHISLDKQDSQEYLLKPNRNESSSHFFLAYQINKYLSKFTKDIYQYKTVNPDIVFIANNKKIAIEIETGSCFSHKKKFKIKVNNLKKNFNDYFFVLTDSKLKFKYEKYGKVILRHEVINKINEYFRNKK